MAWAGSARSLPTLLISRLWFNGRNVFLPGRVLAHGHHPGAIPGSRTNSLQAARQHAAESPKLSLLRAARRQPAILIWGRGRQAMHLLCKQVDVGALPTDSTILRLEPRRLQGKDVLHRLGEGGLSTH